MDESKVCTKCNEKKSLTEFHKNGKPSRIKAVCKTCCTYYKSYVLKTEGILLSMAKDRAKKKNLDFNLTHNDIIVPEKCPVLGIKLERNRGGKGAKSNSPTLDRINNDLGYIKGNVQVISFRANTLKNSATIEELEKLLEFMKEERTERIKKTAAVALAATVAAVLAVIFIF